MIYFLSIIKQPSEEAEEVDLDIIFLLDATASDAALPGPDGAQTSRRQAPRRRHVRRGAVGGVWSRCRHGPRAEARRARQEDRRAFQPEQSHAVGLVAGRGPGALGPGAGGGSGGGGGEAEAGARGVSKEEPSAAALSRRPQVYQYRRKGVFLHINMYSLYIYIYFLEKCIIF